VWSGTVHHLGDADKPDTPGAVQGDLRLVWRRTFSLEWRLTESTESGSWRGLDWTVAEPQFGFEFAGVVRPLHVQYADRFSGWSNGGTLGQPTAKIARLVGHLINLPAIHGSQFVRDEASNRIWNGRWQTKAAGWCITIDSSPDQRMDFQQASRDETFAITHTFQLARLDGSAFDSSTAESATFGLQLALSFAVGYSVGIVSPIGFNADDEEVWTYIGPPHTGRAQRASGWWVDSRSRDLGEYLDLFMGQWVDPAPTDPLRFAATSAVLANVTGFVEQRVIAALSALETLSWTAEVIEGTWPETQWRRSAARRLRRLLDNAGVNPTFSASPGKAALSRYGRAQNYHDLAETVVEVRNRITHPKPDHNIYAHERVLLETWQHATFWLELAILHRLKYQGHVANRTIPGRSVGQSERVPWTEVSDRPEDKN
jgi:hypothetical protein